MRPPLNVPSRARPTRLGAFPDLVGTAIFWVVLLAGFAASFTASVAAAEPSPTPAITRPPPNCTERYPADGPAGVDLRLGCIVAELVGAYTAPGDTATAPRISSWLGPIAFAGAGVALVWIVVRSMSRRVGTRLAPVVPAAWWSCSGCRSLNADGIVACYRCRRPRTDEPTLIPGSDGPDGPRSAGDTRDLD